MEQDLSNPNGSYHKTKVINVSKDGIPLRRRAAGVLRRILPPGRQARRLTGGFLELAADVLTSQE
jgi:hypothetical protein